MVGSVPALQMANLEANKAQQKAEALIFLFLFCFGNLCIQALDNYFGPEALDDFFFFWNAVVGAYCFYERDLRYFTQWAFIKRNRQLLTMKMLVDKSLLSIIVRVVAKLLEFFSFLQCSTPQTALLSEVFLSLYVVSTLTE